jgi:dTDP-4-amino-4,6-dideoxygalactose transaminase
LTDTFGSNWPPRWPDQREADIAAVTEALRNDSWSRGRAIDRFEQDFAAFMGSRFALAVASGTQGLILALRAVGVCPGDEVIVPALTWPATAVAVLECGAVPILADVSPESYCIGPREIEDRLTPATRAVIPVHLYCSAADMAAIGSLCRRHGLALIEDAAQGHGGRFGQGRLGGLSDIGVFSFHEKKLLPSGEGGCVVTSDQELHRRLFELRDHGERPPGCDTLAAAITGVNARLSNLQAALLGARLPTLDGLLEQQARSSAQLEAALADLAPWFRPLAAPRGLTLRSYYSSCWKVDGLDRDRFLEHASQRTRLGWSKPYRPLSDGFVDFCRNHQHGTTIASERLRLPTPVADRAWSSEGVRFPHPALLGSPHQIAALADGIRAAVEASLPAGVTGAPALRRHA